MCYSLDDTIVAVATPPGVGALGIVRLSGNEAFKIASKVLQKPSGGFYSVGSLPSHTVHYAFLVDPVGGERIDEVLFALFKAPKSYTSQDMVEVTCHGGPVVLERALEAFVVAGARLARPGEFTLRAFLLGRLDLAQAEAVADLIESASEEGRRAALAQLEGGLSRKMGELAQALREVLVELEAAIDFPDEGVELGNHLAERVDGVVREIEGLMATYREGKLCREGVSVAIVGLPNVGKSSLFNALVGEDRAIVTSQPGTTRDVVEAQVALGGVLFRFMDTAGFRESGDEAEGEGVKRARKCMEEGDLVLVVLDRSRPLQEGDRVLVREVGGRGVVVVNKIDLPGAWSQEDLGRVMVGRPTFHVSAKRGDGLESLKKALIEMVGRGRRREGEIPLVTNVRHYQALIGAKEALLRSLKAWQEGLSAEFVAADVKGALEALGEITGETTPEDVLDAIFSRFCIGK